jgi:L-ascorbate metabolism protein UlaG (beta-lactamase superfamily)
VVAGVPEGVLLLEVGYYNTFRFPMKIHQCFLHDKMAAQLAIPMHLELFPLLLDSGERDRRMTWVN